MLSRAVKTLYENPAEGDLLMDAPDSSSWTQLRKMAKDKKAWTQAVRKIKDGIYVRTRGKKYKRKGKQPQKVKKKKTKKTEDKKNETKKTASSGKDKKQEDEDSEDEEWDTWKTKNAGPRKEVLPPIKCRDGFTMSVQASREH